MFHGGWNILYIVLRLCWESVRKIKAIVERFFNNYTAITCWATFHYMVFPLCEGSSDRGWGWEREDPQIRIKPFHRENHLLNYYAITCYYLCSNVGANPANRPWIQSRPQYYNINNNCTFRQNLYRIWKIRIKLNDEKDAFKNLGLIV